MTEKGQATITGNRIYWLDNLRTFMIFLVVLFHASVVYEKTGMGVLWWIIIDPATNDVPGIIFLILNIFVIATLFFISGFLAPLSLENKKGWAFLKSKFKRLIIPWILAVLTLIPLYKVIFLSSRNLPQESWSTYFHWSVIWSQNWLWFLPVLFVFEILYLFFSRVNTSTITLKMAIGVVFSICFLYSFFMDFFDLHGWTKTVLIDFQNERLLIYFMIFLLGSQCYKLKIFELEWRNKKLDIILHSTGWIPINLYLFFLIFSLISPGNYLISEIVDTLILRLNFVLSLAYLLYAMTAIFWRYFDKPGNIWNELNQNSYYVFIIHVVVMGGIALTMLNTVIPSVLKFLILTVSTYVASNLIIFLIGKVTKSKGPYSSQARI